MVLDSLRTTASPWEQRQLPRFPALNASLKVDVVVVGAGLTGITTAWLLREAGCSVALLESNRVGAGDTAHTTAHLTYVTDLRLHDLIGSFGQDGARAVWEGGAAAIDQIESIVGAIGADCGFRRVDGYLHVTRVENGKGSVSRETAHLREDAECASRLGFDARFEERVPFHDVAGIHFARQAAFDPSRYLAALVARLVARGCQIFEDSPVDAIDARPHAVRSGGHKIDCACVVLATHNPLSGSVGAVRSTIFQTKLALYTSYVLGARVPKGTVPDALFWDTSDPYDYLRIEPRDDHQLVIFGGADSKTGQDDDEAAFRSLENRLHSMLPTAQISHRWLGQVIETDDGLPFIGEHAKGEFIATGYSGNGFTFGTLAAMMARDSVLGRSNPWGELFRPDRKPFHGGVWHYVKENLDYPWYLLRDRLGRADTDDLRDVPAGQGRIVALSQGKCAVYRAEDGNLSVCSAVCTHLKCLVRWNPADRTWDCPCHGSRFRPDGEVLSGPAEKPLMRIEIPIE
jgi:glycine/D-amino acid oxidase-like deaminating enzyme/nitrite reductase/ring-hydroxylating ferredoxin subunit